MKKRIAPVKKGTKEAMSFRKEFCQRIKHYCATVNTLFNEAGKFLGLLSCSLNRERQYNNFEFIMFNVLFLLLFFKKKQELLFSLLFADKKVHQCTHWGGNMCWGIKNFFWITYETNLYGKQRFQKHQLHSSNVTGESLALFRYVVSLMRASFLSTMDNDGS